MNVVELLQAHARSHPNAIALVEGVGRRQRRISFEELELASSRVAALLQQSGLSRGDTVLVFHPMSVELYIAIAALLRAGLVVMFIDPSAGKSYIDSCCQLHRPRGLIAASRIHLLCSLSAELRRIPVKFSIGWRVPRIIRLEGSSRHAYDSTIQQCDPATAALISFTTANGIEPKAALRTHGFLLAQHQAVANNLQLQAGDVELVTLPIFILANLASRVTSIIPAGDIRRPEAIAAGPIVEQLLGCGVTRVGAPPAFFERLADHCERQSIGLPDLRQVWTGGGPVSPRLLDRLCRIAPDANISVVYGATEVEPISTLSLRDIDRADQQAMAEGRGLLVGSPVPGLDVRVVRDQWGTRIGPFRSEGFEELVQPTHVPGEIVVSGQHVLPGYLYGKGDEEHKIAVDGTRWHRTGDAGYLDSRGRLWLVGRCSARVDDRQGHLYPLGVENAALQYDCIRRAAFLSLNGQRTLAVELDRKAGRPDFASLLKSLSFSGVESIRVLSKIPVDRRHNTKIDYRALRTLIEES